MNVCVKDLYLIFFVIIIFYLIYFKICNNKEGFDATSDMKDIINQVYNADIEAIRNLSSVATQLTTKGGLIVPGQLQITDSINLGDPSNMSGTANASGTASGKMLMFDNTFNGTAGQGIPANKIRLHNNNNAWVGGFGLEGGGVTYNSGDSHRFYVGSSGTKYGDLALNIDGAKNTTVNGELYVKNNLVLQGDNQWILHTPDDGRKTMYIAPWTNNTWDWANNISFDNNSTINCNKLQLKENRARYIRIGNKQVPELRQNSWTLIEAKVYNSDGVNIALNKPVAILEGSATNGTAPGNITNNQIFPNNAQADNYNLGYHGNDGINVLQIDLGGNNYISQIELYNRWNADVDWRMNGTTIELYDESGARNKIIYTGLWHRQYSKTFLL
jgi:hypothetical protein